MCCQIGGVADGDRQHLGLASFSLVDGRKLSGNLDAARDDRGDLSRVEHAIADMSFLSAFTIILQTAMKRLASLLQIAIAAALVIVLSHGLASAEQKEAIAYESLQRGRSLSASAS